MQIASDDRIDGSEFRVHNPEASDGLEVTVEATDFFGEGSCEILVYEDHDGDGLLGDADRRGGPVARETYPVTAVKPQPPAGAQPVFADTNGAEQVLFSGVVSGWSYDCMLVLAHENGVTTFDGNLAVVSGTGFDEFLQRRTTGVVRFGPTDAREAYVAWGPLGTVIMHVDEGTLDKVGGIGIGNGAFVDAARAVDGTDAVTLTDAATKQLVTLALGGPPGQKELQTVGTLPLRVLGGPSPFDTRTPLSALLLDAGTGTFLTVGEAAAGDAAPAQIHVVQSTTPPTFTFVGEAGEGARQLRGAYVAPGVFVFAVSNQLSNTLTVGALDTAGLRFLRHVPAGEQPVGIDVEAVNGDLVVYSTGFADGTARRTTIDAANGDVLDDRSVLLPSGMETPAYITRDKGLTAITAVTRIGLFPPGTLFPEPQTAATR
jgi:hypothetical protein